MNATPAHVETAIREAIGALPLVKTRESMARYLDQRAAFCLEAADNASGVAERLDGDIAMDLYSEARDFFQEFKRIDAMRVTPVYA